MSPPPKITVVVPCHDLGQYLEEAVESVRAQTLQDLEIIVVDDGSTDPLTREVLQRLAGVEVLLTNHRGPSAARNAGIRAARGEYICSVDADDRLEPDWLERAAAVLDADPDVTFVSHWIRTFGDEEWEQTPQRCDLLTLLDRNTLGCAALVRRQALLDADLFDEEMHRFEDWDLWLRLVERGHRGVIIPRVLYHYRRRPGSLSRAFDTTHLQLFERLIHKHEDSYRRHLLELLQRREVAIAGLRWLADDLDHEHHHRLLPEIERLRQELPLLRRRVEEARGQPLFAENRQLRREVLRLQEKATAAERERERLSRSVGDLWLALENARAEVAALHDSWSWRVTRPLRRVYERLLRLPRGPR
jgi:glycosyltransferase involved in cell wall biosynthesis